MCRRNSSPAKGDVPFELVFIRYGFCILVHCCPSARRRFPISSFAEPNAYPSDIQGHNTSSTSILVQWGEVPAADQNGVILSYTVTYKALPDGSPQTKVVSAPTTEVTLTGLNEYANYSITVFASTVKGGGLVSDPTFVVTAQDSKFHSSNF